MPIERIVAAADGRELLVGGRPGPCGPDSELYYDWGEEHGCGEPDCAPACPRCARFLEFWNLVFMAYEQHPDGTLTPLPKENIDTGLGLERGAAILQDVMSVYDTDGYRQIMDWIAAESGVAYGDSPAATKAPHPRRPRPRHDVPRGRRRHAVQRGSRLRAAPHHPPSCPAGAVDRARGRLAAGRRREQMGDAYPELASTKPRSIENVIKAEEERFEETLAARPRALRGAANQPAISADDAFTLAATYGFPVELTVELAEERASRWTSTATAQLMAEHRRGLHGAISPPSRYVRSKGRAPSSSATRRRKCSPRSRRSSRTRTAASAPSSTSRPSTRRAAARCRTPGSSSTWTTGARRARRRGARRRRPDAALRGRGLRRRRSCARRRPVEPPLSRQWRITRRPISCTRLSGGARGPRTPGWLGRSAGQAPLRLHARQALTRRRARRRPAARKREGLREPPGARVRRAARRGEELGATMLFGEKYGEDVRVIEIPATRWSSAEGRTCRRRRRSAVRHPLRGLVASGVRRIEAVTSGEAYAFLESRSHELDAMRAELERVRKEKPRRVAPRSSMSTPT